MEPFIRTWPHRLRFAALALVFPGACAPPPAPETPRDHAQGASSRRAILVSFDALHEGRVRASLPREAVPHFHALFDRGACAAHAVSAFPSVTAPSHSALWTGAYGDVTGVTGNWQPRLPRDQHTLLEGASGFSHEMLSAEPIWIAAGRTGRDVVGHYVTQAPFAPGYLPLEGERDARLLERRRESEQALAMPGVRVLNGYDWRVSPHLVLTAESTPPRPAANWRNTDRLGRVGVPLLEAAWEAAGDSVYALFYGDREYTHVLAARSRDAARGVVATAPPAESAPFEGRELGRHFSGPLAIRMEDGTAFLRVRLFELAPDAQSYLIYQPAMYTVMGNRPDVQAAYDSAVQGWIGNSPLGEYGRGLFGPTLLQGGDGTAEARYLETAELMTRQFMRGVEWAWHELGTDLLLDYFPLADAIDHALYGYLEPRWPGYRADVAEQVQRLRVRVWQLVDLRLAGLQRLVAGDPNAALFVSGDHGMRATWRVFRPNVMLRDAGLLHVGPDGAIDLSRTRALSPNAYWININRTAWRGGIVTPAEERAVIDAVERALRELRDEQGAPVVTATYRPDDHPGLGIGGPTGGDVYYGTAEGVRWSSDLRGPALGDGAISAGHGFPSTEPDMHTAFCMMGDAVQSRRAHAVRTVDAAPTVAHWLGFPAPRDAVGESALVELLGRAEAAGRP